MKTVKKIHNGALSTCPRLLEFFADDAVTFDEGIVQHWKFAQLLNWIKCTKFQRVTMSSSKVTASSAKNLRSLRRMNIAPLCIFFNFSFCLLSAFILSLFGNVVIDILGVIQEKVCQHIFKLPYDIINWLKICIKYRPIFYWSNLETKISREQEKILPLTL